MTKQKHSSIKPRIFRLAVLFCIVRMVCGRILGTSGFAVSSLWSPSWVPAIANGHCGFGGHRGSPCSYWGWSIAWNTSVWSTLSPKVGIPRHRCSTVIGKYWPSTISCWANKTKMADLISFSGHSLQCLLYVSEIITLLNDTAYCKLLLISV